MKRKVGIGLIIGAALPLLATSIAWACGVLATAQSSKRVVAPGEAVTITGKNYSTSATASAVTADRTRLVRPPGAAVQRQRHAEVRHPGAHLDSRAGRGRGRSHAVDGQHAVRSGFLRD